MSAEECDLGRAGFEVSEDIQVETLVDSEKWGLNSEDKDKAVTRFGSHRCRGDR